MAERIIRGSCALGSADVAPETVHEAATPRNETQDHASEQIFEKSGRSNLTSGLCPPARRTSGKLPKPRELTRGRRRRDR